MVSRHYTEDRAEREALIQQIGIGKEVATFRVDRHHPNGPELHTVTSTGIIIIRNERTHKLVTKIIARPNQIRRYFDKETEIVTLLMTIAREHQRRGYNI